MFVRILSSSGFSTPFSCLSQIAEVSLTQKVPNESWHSAAMLFLNVVPGYRVSRKTWKHQGILQLLFPGLQRILLQKTL